MKKFIAITALVFVAAIVSTVCFAVALGSTAVKDIMSGDWDIKLDGIEDKLEAIGDKFEANFDDDDDDDNSKLVQSFSLDEIPEFGDNDVIKIGCDAAEIIVVPSTDGKACVEMNVYSAIKRDYSDKYKILTDKGDFDVYFSQSKVLAGTSVKCFVYIPESVKTVIVDSSVAEVKIKGVNLDNIDVKVNTGEVDIESTTTERANINVNTGEIGLEHGFVVGSELRAVVNTGEINYDIPSGKGFVINYDADLGSVEVKPELKSMCNFYDDAGDKVTSPATKGKIEYKPDADSTFTAYLEVNIGSMELIKDY